jgi:hypothetical protein
MREVQVAVWLPPEIPVRRLILEDVGTNFKTWTKAIPDTAPNPSVRSFDPSRSALCHLKKRLV